jgi:hypothetical protein
LFNRVNRDADCDWRNIQIITHAANFVLSIFDKKHIPSMRDKWKLIFDDCFVLEQDGDIVEHVDVVLGTSESTQNTDLLATWQQVHRLAFGFTPIISEEIENK